MLFMATPILNERLHFNACAVVKVRDFYAAGSFYEC